MITRFHIENFKSLVDFDLPTKDGELAPFTCLIGLNGAGKSTLLQAFDFVTQVAQGTVAEWLRERAWKSGELVSHLGKKSWIITFVVHFRCADGTAAEWGAKFNTKLLRCTQEWVVKGGAPILKLAEGQFSIAQGDTDASRTSTDKIQFEYSGSILSALKLADLHPALAETKDELLSLRSLELLSPQSMHRNSRGNDDSDIGSGGQYLAGYLGKLSLQQKEELIGQLKIFYPQFQELQVKTKRFGWKKLLVREAYEGNLGTEAAHLNDGLLRVLAILAQSFTHKHKFLLFDEIENGVNPALVEQLVDFLVSLGRKGKQIVVTTHSPVILNFLEDSVARDAVIFLYKTKRGHTRACRFFDQPETRFKLDLLGPGEVFVDTDLAAMAERLSVEADQEGNHGNGESKK